MTKFLAKILLLLLTRWKVEGQENIPPDGPLIIVANHLSLADPPVLGIIINRRVVFMAKEELFQARFSSYFIRYFSFPVRRGGLDRKTLLRAKQSLNHHLALVMFPEGRRSKTIRLQSAFSGSALLASRIGAPILPVGITGTEHIKGIAWWLRRPKITVKIGYPFYLTSANEKIKKAERTQLTESMMEHIAGLLPPEYRGKYSGRQISEHEN